MNKRLFVIVQNSFKIQNPNLSPFNSNVFKSPNMENGEKINIETDSFSSSSSKKERNKKYKQSN